MPFDVRAYLQSMNVEVQTTYNDGTEWVIQCSCDDKPSNQAEWHLWVNVEKGQGYCYRCKRRLADPIAIVRFVEGLNFPQALRRIKDAVAPSTRLQDAIAGLMAKPGTKEVVAVEEIKLPAEFIPAWKATKLPSYFTQRGLTKKDCLDYLLGWCDDGFYARRLVVPVFDLNEQLATFVARWMGKGSPPPLVMPDGSVKKGRKVLYPKHSRTSKVLFNQATAAEHDPVVVVEGVFDAMRVGACACALLGKHASRVQVQHLVDMGQTRRLVIMLDTDAHEEAEELAEELAELCPDVRLATLPSHRGDPGESLPVELRRSIKRARVIDAARDRLASALSGL